MIVDPTRRRVYRPAEEIVEEQRVYDDGPAPERIHWRA
jgi:hypothetical protein